MYCRGQTLWGAEYVAWNAFGSNAMCSQCAASLMLEVTQGGLYGISGDINEIYGGPTGYMRGLLSHETWSGESSFGFGIPPGSVLRNKIGGKLTLAPIRVTINVNNVFFQLPMIT